MQSDVHAIMLVAGIEHLAMLMSSEFGAMLPACALGGEHFPLDMGDANAEPDDCKWCIMAAHLRYAHSVRKEMEAQHGDRKGAGE